MLNEIASAKIVITDRLHGMLMSVLTGTPCIVLSNSYHKISAYRTWVSDLPYIRFIEDPNELSGAVRSLDLNRTYEYPLAEKRALFTEYGDAISSVCKLGSAPVDDTEIMHIAEKTMERKDSVLAAYYDAAAEEQWKKLQEIRERLTAMNVTELAGDEAAAVANPVRFYVNTCKSLAARPRGDELPGAVYLKECGLSKPNVTVVIPSLNNEDTIRRTLDSVIGQTLSDIEILCVNDGSTDSTVDIMLEYASRDHRVTVLEHPVNESLGAGRNTGIKFAKGRYIQFLDADDELKADALATLVSEADKRKLDILFFDGMTVFETPELEDNNTWYRDAYEYNRDYEDVMSGPEYYCSATEDAKLKVHAGMALYRTQFLKENGIGFVEGIYHEDIPFTNTALLSAERVWHLAAKFYVRYLRNDTIMTSPKKAMHLYGYYTSIIVLERLAHERFVSERVNKCLSINIMNCIRNLRQTYDALSDKESCIKQLTDVEKETVDLLLKDYKKIDQQHREELAAAQKDYLQKSKAAEDKYRVALDENKAKIMELEKDLSLQRESMTSELEEKRKELERVTSDYNAVLSSRSFRIGCILTWLPRKIKNLIFRT